ncbi:Uncharacterised protein [Bordetella pertussis]|nr:Uncharacterised protein [Bordetella pertussis]
MAAAREGHRIDPVQFHGTAGQAGALGHFPRFVLHPAIDLAPAMAPGGHGIGRREFGIAGDGAVK